MAIVVAGALVRALGLLIIYGTLPPPFFYDIRDTWMDWFNSAWFARDRGTYDVWDSIYPPISFVFLRIFGLGQCYDMDVLAARDCDWLGAVSLHGFYLLNLYLIAKSYLKIDRSTALPRAFVLVAGMPMLNGLDRGNLVIVCLTCFILAFGPLVRSARIRWLMIGCAINFKVYLIASLVPQLIRRRWRWFEGAIIATAMVYLATYGLLGRGTVLQIIDNIRQFSLSTAAGSFIDAWNAGTYTPLIDILSGRTSPIILIAGSRPAETWTIVLGLAMHFAQLMIVVAFVAAWLRPEAVPVFRLTNLGTLMALITSEAGAYTQVLFLYLTLMERWKGFGRPWALIACYVLCLPVDIKLWPIGWVQGESFLANGTRFVEYWVTLAPFLRPGIILMIPIALSCVTVSDVWKDLMADDGRHRRRFWRDLPLLNGRYRRDSSSPAVECYPGTP